MWHISKTITLLSINLIVSTILQFCLYVENIYYLTAVKISMLAFKEHPLVVYKISLKVLSNLTS